MIPVPSHNLTMRDGGLALAGSAVGSSFKIGTSTSGTASTFESFAGTDVQGVYDTLGDGPLPNATAKHLIHSGGQPVTTYKQTPTTAGASSAVTKVGGGPNVTLSGTPNDQYEYIIKIVGGGVVGTSTFQYSADGGDSWSPIYATAATFLMPSGVTANFAAGTYVANETYSWTDTAPTMTTGDVGTAMDAIIASAYDGEFVHILGQTADASSCLTMATLVATKVATAWAAHRYFFALMEAPAVAPSGLATSFSAFESKGVIICGGFAEIINDKTGEVQKRSVARSIAPRIARNPFAVAIARDVSDSDLDPLPDIVRLVPDGAAASTGYYDAANDQTLNNARFTTCMSFVGRGGYYPTGTGLTMASVTSDYQLIPYLRIILQAARVWYLYGLTNLVRRLRVDPKTGFILPLLADAIERQGESRIRTGLGDNIDGVKVTVNREDKIASEQVLRAKIRVVVGGYLITFESEIGLADSLPVAA